MVRYAFYSMNVSAYNATDEKCLSLLRNFLETLYGESPIAHFYIHEYECAYQYCIQSIHINLIPLMVREGTEMRGHCALIVDNRLPQGTAFFGFFEVIEDKETFDCLWQAQRPRKWKCMASVSMHEGR
jgi:hypothetical protein